jgi:hypothetical protein
MQESGKPNIYVESQMLAVLSDRVSKLERQNRRFRQTGLLALLALMSFFVMGQGKATKTIPMKAVKSIEAGRFILQDGSGKKRAELGLFLDRPALVVYDREGNATLSLGEDAAGSGLNIFDSRSEKAASIGYTSNGPMVTLYEGGNKKLNLSVTAMGPALGLVGKKGEAKVAIGLADQESPFLYLFGAGERGGAQLLAAPDRTTLKFFDASDKTRAVLGVLEKESAPGLVLNDGAGISRAILMLTPEGPSLDFFDTNRVRTWFAH